MSPAAVAFAAALAAAAAGGCCLAAAVGLWRAIVRARTDDAHETATVTEVVGG